MVKRLSLLGSTGSIGRQTLSLVDDLGIEIEALSGYSNWQLLEQQALLHKPRYICAVDETAARELKTRLAHTSTTVLGGEQGLIELAAMPGADCVLNAVVGVAGLKPALAALDAKKTLALANKESLVVGGRLVTAAAAHSNTRILPVDSEHSAIFQCLQDDESKKALRRIFLTASGGPFFGWTKDELRDVTPAMALKHPNWQMGQKITIDSATLMNKGLELIEAMWLFDIAPEDIEITVHRQSIVHSMVELVDRSVLAQLGLPDMRLPIQYALTYPERKQCPVAPLGIEAMSTLTFERPDPDTFLALAACQKAAKAGGLLPCAANAANEQAVALFLEEKIGFLDIGELVMHAVEETKNKTSFTLEDLFETDKFAREQVLARL